MLKLEIFLVSNWQENALSNNMKELQNNIIEDLTRYLLLSLVDISSVTKDKGALGKMFAVDNIQYVSVEEWIMIVKY